MRVKQTSAADWNGRPLLTGLLRLTLAGVLGATCLPVGVGHAQVPPPNVAPQTDPGLINRADQRNRLQLEQQTAPIDTGPAVVAPGSGPAVLAPPGGPKVLLRSVTFDTSKFLSPAELQALAAPLIGTKVDISQIQKLVKAVNDLYAERAIVTSSAILPPQDLKAGNLHIALVEGRLGQVQTKGAVQLSPDFVISRIAGAPGEVIDVPALTDDVARFNKTGVAQVQAFLQPGAQFGMTDIQLAVTEPPVNALNLFIDNQGVRSVGNIEGGFLFQKYAPLGIDDKLTVYFVKSAGNTSGNVAYNVPFDLTGGRVGFSVSRGDIRVVDGPYRPLNITGDSTIAAFNASQPLFVNADWLFLLNGAFTYYNSVSDQADVIHITNNDTEKGSIGFTLGYTSPNFSASLSPSYSRAHTKFNILGTTQDFSLGNGVYSALARLPADFALTVGGAFQVSSAALLPGDQLFQIGGPTTVRGYPTDAVAGASGYYGNLELHHPLSMVLPGLDVFAFYDKGAVYNPSPKVINLNSAGVGFSYDIKNVALAEVSAGFPITRALDTQSDFEIYFRLTAKLQ